ncbi:hypothetical protein GCM10011499_39690 [Pelagibacterium lentulum]|uniref:Uncharacterized protein n=1 Tax=Pelagibacterium lentulum TaxID=2029865 RepID=A0A916W4Q0_9HYPH|nr:hypothetical protein GCM10011499_39690 [Pelagibacterium lentulum]
MDDAGIVAERQGPRNTGDVAPEDDSTRSNKKPCLLSSPALRRTVDWTAWVEHQDADFGVILDNLRHFNKDLPGFS